MAFNRPNPASTARQDVEFRSCGVICRGWLTYPERAAAGPVPLIVMAHGFGALRDQGLEPFARQFNAAGMATLIFDYRTFGASDGEPRCDLDHREEIRDWHAAIAYGRMLPGIDPERVAVWGTSFSGGLVVSVAAQDDSIAALSSQCPMLDGLAATMQKMRNSRPRELLRNTLVGTRDTLAARLGKPATYVDTVGHPGDLAAMTSHDAVEGHKRISGDVRNVVTARSLLRVSECRPILDAPKVRCPALLVICENDSVAPSSAATRAAAMMPQAETRRYPYGHFDIYVGEAFEVIVKEQVRFFRQHLG